MAVILPNPRGADVFPAGRRYNPPVSARITTRFAPSPTGELHLGNARTALFSWLFARHHGGRSVLRIEGTGTQRSTGSFTAALMADLQWMGLQWDAGPGRAAAGEEFFQSKRGAVYERYST